MRLQIRDAIALSVVFWAGFIAWVDPTYRDQFFGIVASIVTGYFALSIPKPN